MTDLFKIYQDTYLGIRAEYGHPDEPILYMNWIYLETVPPKGWDKATYAGYFDEVNRLTGWYRAAREYAVKKRKRPEDRAAYLEACDQFGVAGHDLQFAGEPAQTILI